MNESATPENTFVKSRNQSQVDVPSFNQLSVEMLGSNYQADASSATSEKWAAPVSHPVIRSSTTASASSAMDLDPIDPQSGFEGGEGEQVFTPDAESANNDEFVLAPNELSNPDSASIDSCDVAPESTDQADISSPTINQAVDSSPEVPQNDSSDFEPADVSTPNIPQTDDASSNVEPTDNLTPTVEETDKVSFHIEQADNLSPNTKSSYMAGENSRNVEHSDDALSNHSKSRPLSGIEICAPAGDVPVSKLMEMIMSLQTQLTQLMVSLFVVLVS